MFSPSIAIYLEISVFFFCLTRVLSFIEIVGIKNVCAWKLRGHFYKVFFLSRSFCVSLSSIQDKDDFSF